jgi:hypothetical protein
MTIEINNFLLDLAGIDSQLDVNGLGNYRAFLNRLDEVIITKETTPESLELEPKLMSCIKSLMFLGIPADDRFFRQTYRKTRKM